MMRLAVLIISIMVLAACATPEKTNFYVLSSESPPPVKAVSKPEYRVVIEPATLPEALDRPQIVLRVAPNRYSISDAERWSESLKREIPRVIAEAVGQQLPVAHVAVDLQQGGQGADYFVLIDVLRFESVPGDSITLEAAWSVRNRSGKRLREARSVLVEKVANPGVAPLISAHAKALNALGLKIAHAINSIVHEQ
ncbi:PqiC family protein [Sulfurirhabdus autotrophica]|uniref:ABC-type transport auxiliary lipoprotein component domain-containing protein n=1 Tax=Sulfurirhabdus autotrophica TaxID=1706046 RepID=A0A4R3YBZ3_9PROT|nr:PqiC family protein [Sulfurirhabdus autotrophica]TCV89490.1 hypothetical protein EDC63_1027 [Sulfurirhabdus autotrophica]